MSEEAVIGIVVAYFLGLLTSWLFARHSSRELRAIASAFARVAESRGLVTWTRDSKGRITFGELVPISRTTFALLLGRMQRVGHTGQLG